MIERYSDHAANERTFLAWVRTAIAIMAFGFLVEKFDLFLSFAAQEMADRHVAAHVPSFGGQTLGNIAGLLLIVLDCAIGREAESAKPTAIPKQITIRFIAIFVHSAL